MGATGFPIGTHPASGRAGLLTLANHTEVPAAVAAILPLIRAGFEARGVDCVPDSALRRVLRSHRIRTADLGVGREQARAIEEEAGAEYLILGSVDVWRAVDDPEIGLSLRIVRVRDMRILAATSVGATGEDFAGLFGFGRVTKIEDLAPRVVRRAFEELDGSTAPWASDEPPDRARVVLLAFDDLSSGGHGGEIVTSILLSRMVDAGFDVLEPGVANDMFLRCGEFPRGEISDSLRRVLLDAAGSRIIVTGVVQELTPAGGAAGTPRFEFGARGIDGSNGRTIFTVDRSADGRDSETILQRGRIRSVAGLVRHSLDRVIEALARVRASDITRTDVGDVRN
jgi:hypothetical protein